MTRSGEARTRLRVIHSRVIATWVAIVVGIALLAFGIAGLVVSWSAHPTTQSLLQVLGFRVNILHSALYVVAGLTLLLSAHAAVVLRRVVVAQTVVFTLLYVFGTALSANRPTRTMWNLDTPDNILHGVLAVLGLTLIMLLYASAMTAPIRRRSRSGPPDRP